MGTDVHAVFQKRTAEGWEDIPSKWEQNRHYFLFSFLADVRNGYGFAGVRTYEPLKPIAAPRGYPPDFVVEDDEHPCSILPYPGRERYYQPNEPLWMGDHSHTWVTGKEILDHAETLSSSVYHGVITLDQYKTWDRKSPPPDYCGGVSGPKILVSDPTTITPETTHVQVCWSEKDKNILGYFLEEVARLMNEHGEIRLVMGFDS